MEVTLVDESKTMCQGECKHGTGICLTESDIDFWYDALESDDIESVEKYLVSVGETRKSELLNGHVCAGGVEAELDSVKGLNLKVAKKMTYSHLINIAAVFGSEKLIELCLKNGVNIFVSDKNDDNLIHILIQANREVPPQYQEKYLNTICMLKQHLTGDQLRQLLHQENNEGYRPLELAAHLGVLPLFQEIFKTNDVYFAGKKNIGMLALHYYDITEYESYEKEEKTRRMKSPMWYFCHLEERWLDAETTRKFFNEGSIKIWCEMKIRSNWPLIFLWFLMRLSVVILSQYWNLSGGSLTKQNRADINSVLSGNLSMNETSCLVETYVIMNPFIASSTVSTMVGYVLVITACCILIFDSIEFIMWITCGWVKRFYRAPGGEIKTIISNGMEFRIVALLWSLSCIVMFISMLMSNNTIFNLSYITFQSMLLWSLLYFAQILPWIGPTVIQIQHLIRQLLSFAVILAMLIIPMSYILVFLLTNNYIGPCPHEINFTNFAQTSYRGFLIMVNMVNLTDYPLEEYISIYTYHIIFVFLMSILILNFVIASFSTTISTMTKNRDTIVMIQRLALAMQIEYRVGAVFPSLVHFLHKCTFQYCPTSKTFYINDLNPRRGPPTM